MCQRLADKGQIGLDVLVLLGKMLARSLESCLDLIESELYRLRGRLAAMSLTNNPEAAVEKYEQAISTA